MDFRASQLAYDNMSEEGPDDFGSCEHCGADLPEMEGEKLDENDLAVARFAGYPIEADAEFCPEDCIAEFMHDFTDPKYLSDYVDEDQVLIRKAIRSFHKNVQGRIK